MSPSGRNCQDGKMESYLHSNLIYINLLSSIFPSFSIDPESNAIMRPLQLVPEISEVDLCRVRPVAHFFEATGQVLTWEALVEKRCRHPSSKKSCLARSSFYKDVLSRPVTDDGPRQVHAERDGPPLRIPNTYRCLSVCLSIGNDTRAAATTYEDAIHRS